MRIAGKRVVVTGGAGFIGSHLVEELAVDNEVTVLDDFSVGSETNLARVSSRIRVIRTDVSEGTHLIEAIAGAHVIFHLAVVCLRVSISDPMRNHLVNDLGTLNLLLAARDSQLERFVYVSSSEVYGDAIDRRLSEDHPLRPTTPYGASKLAGEAYSLSFMRTYGLPVTVVRPFNAYGPRSHVEGASGEVIPKFVARAMAGLPLVIFGDGAQTRDYTWVQDTVRGIRAAAECDRLLGNPVNIAHGEAVQINRLAQLIQQIIGTRVPIQHLPPRPGDVRRQEADTRRSRMFLGFTADTGIEEGLARYIDWVRAQPGEPRSWLLGEEVQNWNREPLAI
jgi:UDP-glucose 4-epimerase